MRSKHPYFTNRARPEGEKVQYFCIFVGTTWNETFREMGRMAQELNMSRSDIARSIISEALGIKYKGTKVLKRTRK